MKEEIGHLIGKKVVRVDETSIYFDDGTEIMFHPYETYVTKGG